MSAWRERLIHLSDRAADPLGFAIPAVLLAVSLWEIWAVTLFPPGIAGPRVLESAGAIAYCGALLMRRRAPVPALGIVLVGNAAQLPYVDPTQQTGLEGFLALLLAVYSVGAHAPQRRGAVAVGVAIAAIAAGDAARSTSSLGSDAGLYSSSPRSGSSGTRCAATAGATSRSRSAPVSSTAAARPTHRPPWRTSGRGSHESCTTSSRTASA